MNGVAYFPWGFESVPKELDTEFAPGCIVERSPELQRWYSETLRNGRRIHEGEPIADSEISFQTLAEVFP